MIRRAMEQREAEQHGRGMAAAATGTDLLRRRRARMSLLLLRPHHWLKNLLVFAPMLLNHRLEDPLTWLNAALAFCLISLTASALYIVNDAIDLDGDRQDPHNEGRPMACGGVPVLWAWILAAGLVAAAVALSLWVSAHARWWVLIYAAGSLLYSTLLKRLLIVDVVLLAFLYVARILFGGAATSIVITQWTLAFSAFLFLSLALVKRVSELRSMAHTGLEGPARRPYRSTDRSLLTMLSAASGYSSLLVLMLYINSPEVGRLYRHPQLLLLALPPLCYWISRTILLAHRGEMHRDPIVFAFADAPSWIAGAVSLAAMLIAC